MSKPYDKSPGLTGANNSDASHASENRTRSRSTLALAMVRHAQAELPKVYDYPVTRGYLNNAFAPTMKWLGSGLNWTSTQGHVQPRTPDSSEQPEPLESQRILKRLSKTKYTCQFRQLNARDKPQAHPICGAFIARTIVT